MNYTALFLIRILFLDCTEKLLDKPENSSNVICYFCRWGHERHLFTYFWYLLLVLVC